VAGRRRRWLHGLLFVVGVGGVVVLVIHIGPATLAEAVGGLAPWLPWVVLLEALRIGADALTTRLLYGKPVPTEALLRAQLLAYPAALLVPAGRAAAEVIKAGLMQRYVGTELAGAAAVKNPALALIGGFAISIPCTLAAFSRWGASPFSWAIALQALTALALAAVILLAARRPEISRGVKLVSSELGATADRIQATVREMEAVPRGPLMSAIANRVLLALQVMVLSRAAGMEDAAMGLIAVGVYLVGAAVGDVVPGKIGATDGSFAVAAHALGVPLGSAVAVALALHAVQLGWALVGALAAMLWRER